ncbi:extracellular solute-binding protein [Brachybacterium sp. AOP24-D1-21]|uniref:extracellular solute-binding protein n=1 Tax=Brachybacterium sp. AOP24-D1-21 TaxID=3457711 RepID=UPI004033D316
MSSIHRHHPHSPSRRGFLRGTAAIGAGSAIGAGALSACSSDSPEEAAVANSKVALPTYARLEGVTPDLQGDGEQTADGYLTYPTDLVTTVSEAPGDGSEITAFLATSAPPPAVRDRNSFWQAIEGELNAQLGLSIIPAGEMNDKFATVVASGDLPDVVQVWTTPTPKADLMSSVFQDITELVSGDAVLDYPRLANLPTESWKHCVFNGAIHGIPIPRGSMSSLCVFMRKDLLRTLGVEAAPATIDEMLALSEEITDTRSNRWAFADIPMATIQMMHGLPNAWSLEDGAFVSAYEHPAMQDALSDAKRFLDAGVIHPDNFNSNVGTLAKQWFNQGSALFTQDTYPAMQGFYRENTAGESFEVELMRFGGATGGEPTTWLGNPTHSVIGLKKGDLERSRMVLRVLDYLAAPMGTSEHQMVNFGIEGETFEMADGAPTLTSMGQQEIGLGLNYLGAPPQAFFLEHQPDTTQMEFEHQAWMVEHGVLNPALGLPSDTRDRQGEQLGKKMGDIQREILQGKLPVAEWEQAVADWREDGGETMREELRAAAEASAA